MLLSVCIIVRDGARHLEQTIMSVKKLADEIIVVDTGSLDNSVNIAKKCGVRVFKISGNSGVAESRNFAREKARAKWILFLDSDEELLDDYGQLRNILRVSKNDGFYLPLTKLEFLSKQKSYIKKNYFDFLSSHLSFRLYKNKKDYFYKGESYQSITDSIIDKNGETSLKILHLPIVKKPLHGVLAEKVSIFSFFYFDIDDGMDIDKVAYQYLKSAIKSFWKNEYNLAIEKLEKGYEMVSLVNRPLILKNQILILLECKHYKRAEKKIKIAIEKYPHEFTFVFFDAYMCYLKGDYQKSFYILKRSFEDEMFANKDINPKLKADIYVLQALNLINSKQIDKGILSKLEKTLEYFPDNQLCLFALLRLREKHGINIYDSYFMEKEDNFEHLLYIIEFYYKKKEYSKIEDILENENFFKDNNNFLLYWQGLLDFKKNNYTSALSNFKNISPDFVLYQDVLSIQWVLNLVMPAGVESKSVINQIKLLGDEYNWQLINFFNEIFFHGQDKILKFDNLLAKFRYYNLTLYYLDYLIEFANSKAIIIMLEIIDSFKFRRSNRDIALLFYHHGFIEEAYEYFKRDTEQINILDDIIIMFNLCNRLKKREEAKRWKKKIELIGDEVYLLEGDSSFLSNNFII
ncbi:MAG: glycosyltransferase [bacterium]